MPKVRKLSNKEKKAILDLYKVTEDQFPKIFLDDPLAVALSLKEGDMIEIKRDDGTKPYFYYRVAVPRK